MSVQISPEFIRGRAPAEIMEAISRNAFPTLPPALKNIHGHDGSSKKTKTMEDSSIKPEVNKTLNGHLPNGTAAISDLQLTPILDAKCFNGRQKVYKHYSKETQCSMKFSIYIPETEDPTEKFHTVIFLSGIMCNEQNFLFKSNFQKAASDLKLIVVGADTSPRGVDYPGDREAPIFGRSAGWYLDATEEPWNKNYRMYSYISKELPALIKKNFPTTGRMGICGHSMGGNGTVVIGLRNPNLFKCISVLAPSCNPTSWGQELIFRKFLGDDEESWKQYDACRVINQYDGPQRNVLLDIGRDDQYFKFLLPERLKECAESNPNNCVKVDVNIQDGYDHSYFFAASFIEKHLKYQKAVLNDDIEPETNGSIEDERSIPN